MTVYVLDKGASGPRLGVRGIVAICGGILAMIPCGTAYIFGNYAPYIISYFRNRTDDTDLRNVDSLWMGMAATMSQIFGAVIGGVTDRYLGPKVTIGIGGLIFSLFTITGYFFMKTTFIYLTITYGFLQNIGSKMVYSLAVQTAIMWLPGRSSLAAGLVLSGYGAGGLVFNQVVTAFINPDNLSPDLETEDGDRYFTDPDLLDQVPLSFLLLGFTFLAMQIAGTIAITPPPLPPALERNVAIDQNGVTLTTSEKQLPTVSEKVQSGVDPSMEMSKNVNTSDANFKETSNVSQNASDVDERFHKKASVKDLVLRAVRMRSFYVVWITIFCFSTSLRFIASLYKSYGQTFIEDDEFLALSGTLSSVFNCFGRPAWGMVMDRFGYKVTLRCIAVFFTAVCATFVLTEHLHKAAFLVWVCALFAAYSICICSVTMRCTYRCVSHGRVCHICTRTEHHHKAAFMVWVCALFAAYSGVWAVVPSTYANCALFAVYDFTEYSFIYHFQFQVTMRCIAVFFTAVCATFVLTEHLHKAAFMVWVCALFAAYSGVWAVVPSTYAKLFGAENTAITYGFVFVSTALSSVATVVVGTTLKDVIGYHGIFYIGGGIGAIPFLLTFLFNGVDREGKPI